MGVLASGSWVDGFAGGVRGCFYFGFLFFRSPEAGADFLTKTLLGGAIEQGGPP